MIDSKAIELSAEDLAPMMCAFLCHDFAGPSQAFNAGMGVLDDKDSADMYDDAIDLIRSGTRQLVAKLQFNRIAFGSLKAGQGQRDTRELEKIIVDMFADVKQEIVWKVEANVLDGCASRLLLNLCTLGVGAVPRGGTVTIEATESAGMTRLRIVSEGRRAILNDAAVKGLDGIPPEKGFCSLSIQPYFTGYIARLAKGRVTAHMGEDRVEIVSLVEVAQDDNIITG